MSDYSFLNIVTTTTGGKKINRKLTHINPNASKENLTLFVQALNSLSEDSLYKVQRVLKNPVSAGTADDEDVDAYLAAIFAGNSEEISTDSDFDSYMDGIFAGSTVQSADTDFENYMDGIFNAA